MQFRSFNKSYECNLVRVCSDHLGSDWRTRLLSTSSQVPGAPAAVQRVLEHAGRHGVIEERGLRDWGMSEFMPWCDVIGVGV